MRRRFISYLRDDEQAGSNISWKAIFAGVVTFVAVFVTLSFITSAIGFGLTNPTSNEPFEGVGTGVIISTIITFILSFMAAGFVSGLASKRIGLLHGFLTWATSVLVIIVLVSYTSISAISGIASVFGGAISTVGKGVGSVAEGAGKVVKDGAEYAFDNLNVDTTEVDKNIKEILRDTDTPELQPEYLNGQLKEVGSELTKALKDLVVNPENKDEIISRVSESLKQRAEKITTSVDRDAIVSAVEKNTDLTGEEAHKAVDNLYEGIQSANEEAKKQLDIAEQKFNELVDKGEQAVEDLREDAEEAAETASTASWVGFIAMLLGLVLTSVCGLYGNRVGQDPEVKTRA